MTIWIYVHVEKHLENFDEGKALSVHVKLRKVISDVRVRVTNSIVHMVFGLTLVVYCTGARENTSRSELCQPPCLLSNVRIVKQNSICRGCTSRYSLAVR